MTNNKNNVDFLMTVMVNESFGSAAVKRSSLRRGRESIEVYREKIMMSHNVGKHFYDEIPLSINSKF